MVQLLRTLRRLATSGTDRIGDAVARDASGEQAGATTGEALRLPSTFEQLDAAATLIEGLGQLRQITVRDPALARAPEQRAAPSVVEAALAPVRAPWRRAFALQAWMEDQAEKARRRARRSLVQRLERALAPLAYPG